MPNLYINILKTIFPRGYSLAFAYGSSVFKQLNHVATKGSMIDFIIAVDNPRKWHKENILKNPDHYSAMKYFGAEKIGKFQDFFGAKVYYNTLIPTDLGLIKYGIISTDSLITDLLDWETLYISGRLHKPVHILHKSRNADLNYALRLNLYSALHTAFLCLPNEFTEQQLYMAIASISYSGDLRMYVAEDKNKVENIVRAQLPEFRKIYYPLIQELKEYVRLDISCAYGEQDPSTVAKYFHLSKLPKKLQMKIVREWNKDGRNRDLEDVLRAAAMDPDSKDIIIKGLNGIVQKSSVTQSLKGIITAGLSKSLKYSLAKVKKKFSS